MVELLLQSNPQPVFIYDAENLQFLEVNNAAVKMYGYTKDEFMQMDLTDLYAPEDIQTLIKATEGKSKDGNATGPWRHKKKDGTSILVELTKSTIQYKGRNSHLSIILDVTKRIQTETSLKQMRAVYNNSSDMVVFTDPEGLITNINDVVIKKLGISRQEIITSSFLSYVSDDDRGIVNTGIFKNSGKEAESIETEIKRKNGKNLPVEIVSNPVHDIFGEIESFAIIIKVIENIKDESVFTPPGVQQKNSNGIDPDFFSNLFHELLTPINVIIGFSQELYEGLEKPTDEQQEAIEIISENQKMLTGIMDTVAEYTHLKQNQYEFNPENLSFINLLHKLESDISKTAEQLGIEFSYGKISSSLMIETDNQKFNMFLNLYVNLALKLTKEKKIFISGMYIDQENCFIGIKDKRGGISENLLNAMNDIFTEDENTLRKNYGISRLTHKLIKSLKDILGIEIHSIEKGGEITEFGISLPVKYDSKKIQIIEEDKEKKTSPKAEENKIPEVKSEQDPVVTKDKEIETPKAEPENKLPGKQTVSYSDISCLYLEDQVDSQILFKVQMKELGKIDFSVSVENALPLIKANKYDVVVMDMNLQGEYNGLDALRIIRKIPGYGEIPVIACSAYVLPGDKDKYKQSGFTDFISKPLMREKIVSSLEKVFDFKM